MDLNLRPAEKVVTDVAGILTAIIGLLSLAESLLNYSILGQALPPFKGTVLSLFTVGFGITLMTSGATKALKQVKKVKE